MAANKREGRNFTQQDLEVMSYLSVPIALHIHNSMLNAQLEGAYTNTIIAMANALEARDKYSRGHSERVAHVAVEFANFLNLDPRTVQIILEGALRRQLNAHMKRLPSINCYRALRHRRGLPVRGQRTKTNARTRKGKRKTVGVQRNPNAKAGKV